MAPSVSPDLESSPEEAGPVFHSRPRDPRRRPSGLLLALPTLVAIGVLLLSPNFRGHPPATGRSVPNRETPLGADFIQEYVGGHIVASDQWQQLYYFQHYNEVQHDPEVVGFRWPQDDYFPMVYPPFYYAATQLLAGLDYRWAMRIWLVLSGLAVSLSGCILLRYYQPGRHLVGYWLAGSLLFIPLLNNFNMAQKGSFLLLILTGSFVLWQQGKPFFAGAVFGLIAFKPHLGLVIGLAMLFSGHWRFATGAVATVVGLVGGSWLAMPSLWNDYLVVATTMGDYVQTSGYQLADSHSLWGAMQLSLGAWAPSSVKAATVVASLAVVSLLGWVLIRRRGDSDRDAAERFAAMLAATVMLSPHFYTYDLTILLLAILLIASSVRPGQWRTDAIERSLVYLLAALFGLAGVFPRIAEATGIQVSVLLLIAIMVLLGLRASGPSNLIKNAHGIANATP